MGLLTFFTRSRSQKQQYSQDSEIDFADRDFWDSLDSGQGISDRSSLDELYEGKPAKVVRGGRHRKANSASGLFAGIFSSHHDHGPRDANESLPTLATHGEIKKKSSSLPSYSTRLASSPRSLSLSASPKKASNYPRKKASSKQPLSGPPTRYSKLHDRSQTATNPGVPVDVVLHRKVSSLTIGKPHVVSSSLEILSSPTKRQNAHRKINSVIVDKKFIEAIVPSSPDASLSPDVMTPSRFIFPSSTRMQRLPRKPARSSLKLRDVRDQKDGLPAKQFADSHRLLPTTSDEEDDWYTDSDGDYTDCSDSEAFEGEFEADEVSLTDSFKESREAVHRERLSKFTWAPSDNSNAPGSSGSGLLKVIKELPGEEINLGNATVRVGVIPPTPTPPESPDSTFDISNSPLLQAMNPTSAGSLSSTPSFYNLRTLFDSIDKNDVRPPLESTNNESDKKHEDLEEEIPSTPDLVYGHRHDKGLSGFQTISTIATSSSEAKTNYTDSPSALSMHADIWEDDEPACNHTRVVDDIGVKYQRDSVDADKMLTSSIASRNSPALSVKSVRFALDKLPDISQPVVEVIPSSVVSPGPISKSADHGDQQQQETLEDHSSADSKDNDNIELEQPISTYGPYAKVIKNYLQLRQDKGRLEINAISLESEISKLQSSYDKLSIDRNNLKLELEILQERFIHADINLTESRDRLENALADANEQDAYISDLNRKLMERDATIEEMRTQLGSLQEDLEELSQQNVDLRSSLANTKAVPSSTDVVPAIALAKNTNECVTDNDSHRPKRTTFRVGKATQMRNPSYTLSLTLHELTWTDMRANKDKIEELQDEIGILNLKASSTSESRIDTSYHLPASVTRTHERTRLLSTTSTLPDTIPEDVAISEAEAQKAVPKYMDF